MTQTKADRQEAAKKAAATRERNQVRDESQTAGRKAAATRQRNRARESVDQAQRAANSAVSNATSAVKSIGGAAAGLGKSVATRVGIGR